MERHRGLGERIITTQDNVASFLPLEIEAGFSKALMHSRPETLGPSTIPGVVSAPTAFVKACPVLPLRKALAAAGLFRRVCAVAGTLTIQLNS